MQTELSYESNVFLTPWYEMYFEYSKTNAVSCAELKYIDENGTFCSMIIIIFSLHLAWLSIMRNGQYNLAT